MKRVRSFLCTRNRVKPRVYIKCLLPDHTALARNCCFNCKERKVVAIRKKSENRRTKKKWESSFSRKGKGGADVPYDEQHASRKPRRSAQSILSFSLLPRFPPRFTCNFFSTVKSRSTTDMRCQSLQPSRKKTKCFFLLQNLKSQEHASSKALAKKEEKQKRQHKALNLMQKKREKKKTTHRGVVETKTT